MEGCGGHCQTCVVSAVGPVWGLVWGHSEACSKIVSWIQRAVGLLVGWLPWQLLGKGRGVRIMRGMTDMYKHTERLHTPTTVSQH